MLISQVSLRSLPRPYLQLQSIVSDLLDLPQEIIDMIMIRIDIDRILALGKTIVPRYVSEHVWLHKPDTDMLEVCAIGSIIGVRTIINRNNDMENHSGRRKYWDIDTFMDKYNIHPDRYNYVAYTDIIFGKSQVIPISRYDIDYSYALYISITYGYSDISEYLIEHGASEKIALRYRTELEYLDSIKSLTDEYVMRHANEYTKRFTDTYYSRDATDDILRQAIISGNLDMIKYINRGWR
jgi:hypothetical protein